MIWENGKVVGDCGGDDGGGGGEVVVWLLMKVNIWWGWFFWNEW